MYWKDFILFWNFSLNIELFIPFRIYQNAYRKTIFKDTLKSGVH